MEVGTHPRIAHTGGPYDKSVAPPPRAFRDGVLIDVSATAREVGIRYPVALTRGVWERCVAIPPGVVCQDEAGQL